MVYGEKALRHGISGDFFLINMEIYKKKGAYINITWFSYVFLLLKDRVLQLFPLKIY